VATNHRLSAFGFMFLDELAGPDYAGSGNRGVQDIAVALKWVHDNIAAFGGDPGNVMIFGESGGGAKTSVLYGMPQAAPYFHKASIESGPGVRMRPRDQAAAATRQFLASLNLAPADWRKLIEMPAADLLAAQQAFRPGAMSTPGAESGARGRPNLLSGLAGGFAPVVDGVVLKAHPFDPAAPASSRGKPLMVGGNEDEQQFFVHEPSYWSLDEAGLLSLVKRRFPDQAERVVATYRGGRPNASPSDLYFAIFSDLFSGVGSNVIAERKVRQGGAPVFRYVLAFDRGDPVPGAPGARYGALHAYDIPLKFNNPRLGGGPRPERDQVAKAMSTLWATFARTGRPAAPGVPDWPAYNLSARPVMYIDAPCHVVNDPHPAERKLWDGMMS